MSVQPYSAHTSYGVQIHIKHLDTFEEAVEWYEQHVSTFPGCYIVQNTEAGSVRVWPLENANVRAV